MAAADKKKSINLPYEIILDILLCLPIKSLMRFRCVNKTWLQLLTNDPQLYLDHLKSNKNDNNPSLLAYRWETLNDEADICSTVELSAYDDQVVNVEIPFCRGTTNPSYVVRAICNGLILVCLLADENEKLFIWNPFSNDYSHIPYPPPPPPLSHYVRSASGNKFGNYFGFCFLEAVNQYKVIRFCDSLFGRCSSDMLMSHVSVYTLGTDWSSWRNLQHIRYYNVLTDSAPTLVNGAFHWIATTGLNSLRILSFDMKDEGFKEIPHPNGTSSYNSRIGELGGLLCISGTKCSKNVDIFVKQQYGVANSWIKHLTIVLTEVPRLLDISLYSFGFTQNREFLLNTGEGELILYNLETNSFKNLAHFGRYFCNAYTYRPSFISPKAITGNGHIM